MNVTLSKLGRIALDLIYPPRCVLCGAGGAMLCTSCEASLPRARRPRCERCWLPKAEAAPCRHCLERPLALDAVRALYRYEEGPRRLVHALKYRDQSALASLMGQAMASLAREEGLAADLVVPVPLAGARARQRGYNQAALLAKAIASEIEAPIVEALRRRRSAPPQAQSATAEARRRNVESAFAARRPELIAAKRVLLVDDVVTTGATLDACARVLRSAGAREVMAITFARED